MAQRLLGRLAGALAIVTCWLLSGSAATTPGCTVLGSVSFGPYVVVGDTPIQVGDEIEVRFTVNAAVYHLDGIELEGTDELFSGDTSSGPPFHLTAIAPGTATLQVAVHYGTEEACPNGEGGTYYQLGPNLTARSDTFEIVVAQAPTPTPTASPTVTASPTLGSDGGGGGCAIGGDSGSPGFVIGSLLLLMLARWLAYFGGRESLRGVAAVPPTNEES